VARILMADADALEQTDRSFAAKLLEEVPVLATTIAAAKRLALLESMQNRGGMVSLW
jgi:hypothetical protein